MREFTKTTGALLGVAGGQITTFIVFAIWAEPCDCTKEVFCGGRGGQDCFADLTFWEYWARYGTGLSICFVVLGWLLGTSMEDT